MFQQFRTFNHSSGSPSSIDLMIHNRNRVGSKLSSLFRRFFAIFLLPQSGAFVCMFLNFCIAYITTLSVHRPATKLVSLASASTSSRPPPPFKAFGSFSLK
uniref:(northern house mosquito) hypothetical protein n=1 Tax=Culex pipiens TaxID=7175 RepID=A0A8D8E312_CULPI